MYTQSGAPHASLSRNEALKRYAPMVKRMAHHMLARLPASVEIDDMIQQGMIGLLDALQRYQADQGAQFETYAAQRIRGAMLDGLRQSDWMPRSVRRAQRRIDKAMQAVEQRNGRPATEPELAGELGLPLEEYQGLLQDARGTQVMFYEDMDAGEDGAEFVERACPDTSQEPLARLADREFKTALVAAIERLPERERNIMGLYYEQEMTLREIADVLGVTESRVCQLHSQAVSRIRARLKGW